MAYQVRTPVFEGPFDLLLHLVMKEQVDVYEVPLSRIVDAYVAHLEDMEVVDLEVATEFLLVAVALLELKARRLLPGPDDVEPDEEVALWEERDLLLARLLECRTFREAAEALRHQAAEAARSLPRVAGMEEPFLGLVPDLLAGVTPEDLSRAARRALQPRPRPRVDLDHVAPIRASVRDAVEELVETLPGLRVASFRRLTYGLARRLDVIVRFLAVLELYKEGLVDLHQAVTFGDLRVSWLGDAQGNGDGAAGRLSVEEYG